MIKVVGFCIVFLTSVSFAKYSEKGKEIIKLHSSWKHEIGKVSLLEKKSFSILDGEAYSYKLATKASIMFSGKALGDDSFIKSMVGLPVEALNEQPEFDDSDLFSNAPESEEMEKEKVKKRKSGTFVINHPNKWIGKYKDEFQIQVSKGRKSFSLKSLKVAEKLNTKFEVSEDELVKKSLRIIRKYDLIDEATLDQLYLIKANHVHFTGKVKDPGDRKIATQVKFGRIINGIPVIGLHNSEVNLIFSSNVENAHEDEDMRFLEEVNVDWSDLNISNLEQEMVDVEIFKKRIKGLYAIGELKRLNLPLSSQNIKNISKKARIDKTICGYVDAEPVSGEYKSDVLQLGCMVFETHEKNVKPSILIVPTGKIVKQQAHWKITLDVDFLERLGEDAEGVSVSNSFEGGK